MVQTTMNVAVQIRKKKPLVKYEITRIIGIYGVARRMIIFMPH